MSDARIENVEEAYEAAVDEYIGRIALVVSLFVPENVARSLAAYAILHDSGFLYPEEIASATSDIKAVQKMAARKSIGTKFAKKAQAYAAHKQTDADSDNACTCAACVMRNELIRLLGTILG